MTDPILPLLAGVVAALFALGLFAAIAPGRAMRIVPLASAGLCAFAAVLAAIGLLAGGRMQTLDIPLGLPGTAMRLGLDGLSGFFLLLLFAVATAASLYAHEPHGTEDRHALACFPVFIGAMALALIAGDGFSLVFGFELMALASWATVLARHEEAGVGDAALLYIGMVVFAAVCLIAAFALLAPPDAAIVSGLRFAAIRAAMPPEGWRAGLVLALVLFGAGSQAGLAPLHVWLPLAHPAAPSHVSALMSGAMTKVALYVIIRVLFDLCGPAQPLWWGVPLILMGAASAVLGALRANTEADIKAVLAASTVENVGLIAIGIGVAMIARAADLPSLAALALGGAMLHAANHGVFKTLLFLCAGAAQHGGGSRVLARLGGLIHRMPVTTACVLVGSLGLAALPPGSGFASAWMLLQSVLAGPRIGGLALQILFAITAALMAMAAALAAAAAVRLIGVGFLGRPRTPRVAAAEEAGPMARRAMIGLAIASCLLGLLPGPVLRLAGPALRVLAGSSVADRAGTLVVAPGTGLPGYAAPAIAVILGLALAATLLVLRRFTRPGHRRGPAWACGFAAAPPWLPFGDPLTQYGGASFSQPLRRALGTSLLHAREQIDMPRPGETRPAGFSVTLRDPAAVYVFAPLGRLHGVIANLADRMQPLTIRRALGVMFAALVLFLAVIALLEAI
jgi:hydrogenase-4 component B